MFKGGAKPQSIKNVLKKGPALILNNWEDDKIIHKSKILEIDWLMDKGLITEIEDGYFYLNKPFVETERLLYEDRTKVIMDKFGIKDIDLELKSLIKKFNTYNEIKDIAQTLIGKIADLRGQTVKEIHEDLGILFGE